MALSALCQTLLRSRTAYRGNGSVLSSWFGKPATRTLQQPHRLRCRTRTKATASSTSTATSRQEHNKIQAQCFDQTVDEFMKPFPEEIHQRLRYIACSVPGLGRDSRVIDVGSGTGCLIPYIQECGVHDILAVDVSPMMLEQLQRRFPPLGTLGNDACVRTCCADVADLPAYQGGADAVFFNAVFGNLFDQRHALLHVSLNLLKAGGYIVISHPMGRRWLEELHRKSPETVPHLLPDEASLIDMVYDLPLNIVDFKDEEELYMALLQVPVGYRIRGPPLRLQGEVVYGFGRGSKEMGVPTANLDPQQVAEVIQGMPAGVYFGCAQLLDGGDEVHKMVMNIGYRPTVEDGSGVSVEVHVLHQYGYDFHGKTMKVLATSYIRPEMKFPSLPALVSRIKADVAIAKYTLDSPGLAQHMNDTWFDTTK